MSLLEARGLEKIYSARGGSVTAALRGVSFAVEEGEFLAIMGESGSGKTTLLNLLATLDRPTGGEVLLKGQALSGIPAGRLSAFRRERLGFVFQDSSLLDTLSLGDNILLPLVLSGAPVPEMTARLLPLAGSLGIGGLLDRYPWEVSGGQRQRAAAARALITRPDLLLADEPTGALDSRSAGELLNFFRAHNRRGQTVVMVTHSVQAASQSDRVLLLRDGKLALELRRRAGGTSTSRWPTVWLWWERGRREMKEKRSIQAPGLYPSPGVSVGPGRGRGGRGGTPLLYPKLAFRNLWNNRGAYLPFLGAASVMVCLFFTVRNVADAPDFAGSVPGGWQIQALVEVGAVLFIFGSVRVLKGLRRRKNFYYRPENFVTVSGMLHRMRKSGAGLANICLFGTMTLVTLCCTLAVALGQDQVMALLGTPNDARNGLGVTLNLERMSPQELTTLFGTLAFLGLFFGAAFLLCTVLVMYYKHLTEGAEDRDGFTVMRRVGMSGAMVRAAARRQITLVFFLPLRMALLHMAVALPVMVRMFQVLCVSPATVLLAAGVGAMAFTALYLAAYRVTARAYYRMVGG